MRPNAGFFHLWPDYRPWALGMAMLIGGLGFFIAETGWADSLMLGLGMAVLGFIAMLMGYPLYFLIRTAIDTVAAWLPGKPEKARAPAAVSPIDTAATRRKPPASAPSPGSGVRIAAPSAPVRVEPDTRVTVLPGVRWLAERMRVWRERIASRKPVGSPTAWGSVEEAAAALEHGLRPAIQRLASELTALSSAAMSVKEGEAMPEIAAARFEAALEHWRAIDAALRARTFAHSMLGDRLVTDILTAIEQRLVRTFDTYIRLANGPRPALRWADGGGQVAIEVDFDCAREVAAFAQWAETQARTQRKSSFWWLVGAFAVGYWLGDD